MADEFLKNILEDIKTDLADAFDRNFERKSFFGEEWKQVKNPNPNGSLMQRTGKLRRSITAKISKDSIVFESNLPYADIQNRGGKIRVTPKMKRFFWAMYYKHTGALGKKKDGTTRRDKRNKVLNAQAQYWKALALKKVGGTLVIPKRQFIGHHPQVDKLVKENINYNVEELNKKIIKKLKHK